MNNEALLIGWGSEDITPDKKVSLRGQFNVRIADNVNDRLTTTALALESLTGSSQAIMVSLDSALVSNVVKHGCRETLASKLPDFDADKLFINATHSHTAPAQGGTNFTDPELDNEVMTEDEYNTFLIEKIVIAAQKAWSCRKPGAISWGKGHAVIGFNRRMAYFDGTAAMYGQTDKPEFSHVEGYEDHGVNLMFTYDAAHNVTGMVVNIPCPSQCTESSSLISADYWHETRQEIRKRHGENLYILPQCSAAGDQSPRTMVDRRADARMMKLKGYQTNNELGDDYNVARRQDIADKIAAVVDEVMPLASLDIQDKIAFAHTTVILKLEERHPMKEEYEEACREVTRWQAKLDELKDEDPASYDYSTTHKRIQFNQRAVRMYEHQLQGKGLIDVEAHIMRLGDIAFCTSPYELYVDYGVRIKERSKAIQTFVVQLVGEGAYLPTQRAMERGGYGAFIASTPIAPEGGQQIVNTMVEAINNLYPE